MKLTDLNIICLEGILEYLDLEDLLNAAESNKRLCHASKFVYIGKYGSSTILFGSVYKSRQECLKNDKLIDIKKEDISVHDLKSIFQMLRNFGHLISRIDITLLSPNNMSSQTRIYIIDYVNFYCHETLSDIFIVMFNQDFLKRFKKPFTRVKSVDIISGFLMQKNGLLWSFPKMEKLEIMLQCHATISESIAYNFPYLKNFKITGERDTCFWEALGSPILPTNHKENECIENFKAFLKLNPQLEYLSMNGTYVRNIEILQMFEEREQNPKSLELSSFDQFLNYLNEKKIHLKNVEHLKIGGSRPDRINFGIPFLFDEFKSFEIYLNGPAEEYIYEFCHNNSTIRKIKFRNLIFLPDDYNINFSRLARSLPLLEGMTVLTGTISVDEVCYVLTQFKFLKYFHFRCRDFDNKRQLIELQLNDWKISIKDNYYIYFKR